MLGAATSRYLVITRAGPQSLHDRWLAPIEDRQFDILVASFDPNSRPVDAPGVFHRFIPGTKVQGWRLTLLDNREFISQYDYIALIDDDIDTNAEAISRTFSLGSAQDFVIFQPSLTWDSYFTYAGSVRNPFFAYRCVNYIEMMAPFFAVRALRQIAPLFDYGWESGIDLVWGSALPPEDRRFAIIDAVSVRHTRPVGSLKEANGFINRTYESDIEAALKHFAMAWPSLVASSAKTAAGCMVGRWGLSWRVLALVALPFYSPTRGAVRRTFDHIRHQWLRRPTYAEGVRVMLAHDAAVRSR
jgi:hypothetical protein